MQVVINVPDIFLEWAKDEMSIEIFDNRSMADAMSSAIRNGIVLPKGHGKLKDVDKLVSHDEYDGQSFTESVFKDDIDDLPTIIEADNAESEEDKELIDQVYQRGNIKEKKIITLCGSTRFKEYFLEVQKKLSLAGYIVLMPGCFSHAGDHITKEQEKMLSHLHRQKIDISDSIFVINVDGYIGESTLSEINYAEKKKKTILYYSDEDKEEINPYEKCKTCGQNMESCCGCPEVLKLEQKKKTRG